MSDKPLDDIAESDKIVDKVAGIAAEKAGEINPELALKPGEPQQNTVKMAVDYGPLIAFGLTFMVCKLFKLVPATDALIWASGALGIASVIALIAGFALERRVAWIPLLSCAISVPMTALTVFLHDPVFVKIKMTIVDVVIGAILIGGVWLGKNPLKALLGDALKLKDEAWPRLTIYYAVFYFVMAGLNEAIWRTQSDSFWVTWKLASIIGGPIIFSLCLLPFMMKSMLPPVTDKPDSAA